MLDELQDSPVSEARVQAILKEMVRQAVAGMIVRQESEAVTEISACYLDRIDTETSHIRDAQRTRDWSVASTFAREIATQNGLDAEVVGAPAVARQVLSLLRRLGHLEGTTIDRHYSDHGLLELKDLLDSVDYGIEVGRDRRFDFPIIVGNRTALQTALDVEVALTDQREISAVQLRDSETDEIVFEAAISGRKAPATYPWNDCEALEEKDVAARIISLGRQYSLTMPAGEEATAALEHLLILVDDKPLYLPAAKRSVTEEATRTENASMADAEPVVQEPGCRAVDLAAGDLVVCALPSRRRVRDLS